MAIDLELRTIDRLMGYKRTFIALLGTIAIAFFTVLGDIIARPMTE